MNEQTGYRATWDPGSPLRIGQVGKLDSTGRFTVYTSLEKAGIEPEVLIGGSSGLIDYSSHDSVSISAKAAGTAPAIGSVFSQADAGFEIKFTGEEGIVFQASGFKTHKIINIAELEQQILEKYAGGTWQKDWLIITTLSEAATATVVISNGSGGSLALKAKAGVNANGLALTDASLGLSVASETGNTLKYISQEGLTPLYSLMGIRHPLFGKTDLKTRGFAEESFQVQKFNPEEIDG
jgi:hypothetical protein